MIVVVRVETEDGFSFPEDWDVLRRPIGSGGTILWRLRRPGRKKTLAFAARRFRVDGVRYWVADMPEAFYSKLVERGVDALPFITALRLSRKLRRRAFTAGLNPIRNSLGQIIAFYPPVSIGGRSPDPFLDGTDWDKVEVLQDLDDLDT